ncbi:TetR/AcrR family transcriptional regulator [Promicromonospora iranensis]|jgi:AcrR family transcriptional regulator|uniref:TetR/AcrR family transcriptional regulator n=1 Tax=Promicromonospora iranensis TaxID=1105144 RepID=UPI0023A9754D|nr:TetR/AcrR family transcriptional regulator [Promicromonospora iranensis]
MPRTAEQNEALRAATRETVQTAAIRVFARDGFAAASIRTIATEAGLSVGSIYRHYATKHELFDEFLDQATGGLAAAAARLEGPGLPLDLIREFTVGYLADLATDKGAAEFFEVVNQGFSTDTPAGTRARLLAPHRSLWQAFSAVVRRGQEAGQLADGDPETMTVCYFATLSGLTTMCLALHDELTMPSADLVLRTLTAGSDDDRGQARRRAR